MKSVNLCITGMLLVILLMPASLLAYSAGNVVNLTQPNGVSFRATLSASEVPYSWQNFTDDGYAFIDGSGGYYYYATLGPNGDYVPSSYKVGINAPVGIPPNLQRTGLALQLQQAYLDSFNALCLEQNQFYLNNRDWTEHHIAYICVEFANVGSAHIPWHHNTNPEYTSEDYLQALNSQGTYHTGLYGVTSPDGEPVFGSVKDYWWEASRWNVVMTSTLVNPVVGGQIQWLEYPGYVAYCSNQNWGQNTTVWNWAVHYADSMGWIPATTEYVVIIGAGTNWHWVPGQGWHIVAPIGGIALPNAYYYNPATGLEITAGWTHHERWDWFGTWYQNPPLSERYFNQVSPPHEYHFTNIGLDAHEGGHAIFGWVHMPSSSHNWNLMLNGASTGPGYSCSCPPHPSAPLTIEMGWVEPTWITENQLGMALGYDGQFSTLLAPEGTPIIYAVEGTQPSNPFQDYWFMENRRYSGFNQYNPGNPYEPTSYPTPNPENNFIVEHQPIMPPGMGYSHLENANNIIGQGTQQENIAFPGLTGRDHFLPTYPDSTVYDSRSVPNSWSASWDGRYQEGFALKNLISDSSANVIRADMYVNYWAGTLDQTPGNFSVAPESLITWSGQDIIVNGQVTVAPYQTLSIAAGSVLTGEAEARLVSNGLTIIEAAEISGDLTLEGNFQINQTVTVAEGVTLNLSPATTLAEGTTFKFGQNASLLVNGNLVAEGGSGVSTIHFQRLNEALAWEGIIIDNQSVMYPETSSLSYCNITGANIGLKTTRAHNLQVANCNISGNNAGIYYIHANAGGDPSFVGNNIYGNDYGLVVFGGAFEHDLSMLQNNIVDNEKVGLFTHSGNSYPIGDNLITGSDIGVLCRNYTHSNFAWSELSHPLGGYNIITGNGQGIKLADGSSPNLGQVNYGFHGKNNITNYDRFALCNTNPHTLIMAEDNWWQSSPPDSGIFYLPAMVDFNPWSPGYNYRSDNLGDFSGSGSPPGYGLWNYIAAAMGYIYSGEPDLAIPIYTQILEQYPNSQATAQALEGLYWATAQENGLPKLMAIGGNLNYVLSPELAQLADYLDLEAYLAQGQPAEALAIAQDLATQARQTDLRLLSQFMVGMIQKHYLRQVSQGNAAFATFAQLYPKDELAAIAQLEQGLTTSAETYGQGASQTLTALPKVFAFYPNYPNPFNPATTIRYDLPENSHVILTIYNLGGQRVTTLLDRTVPAGSHSALWQPNVMLSSGIYFCRFEARSLTSSESISQIRRMLLLK